MVNSTYSIAVPIFNASLGLPRNEGTRDGPLLFNTSPKMPPPNDPHRTLRIAHVDYRHFARLGFELFVAEIGRHALVLSAALGSELLQALRGGLAVDVAIVCVREDMEEDCVLLEQLQKHHPEVRTIAALDEPDEGLSVRANEAGAYGILTMRELTEERLRELLSELDRPAPPDLV